MSLENHLSGGLAKHRCFHDRKLAITYAFAPPINGNTISNCAPPRLDNARMLPQCVIKISRVLASPRPVPEAFKVKRGSNTFSNISSEIPPPSSVYRILPSREFVRVNSSLASTNLKVLWAYAGEQHQSCTNPHLPLLTKPPRSNRLNGRDSPRPESMRHALQYPSLS